VLPEHPFYYAIIIHNVIIVHGYAWQEKRKSKTKYYYNKHEEKKTPIKAMKWVA
jgi:hypothetical protein